MEHSVYINRSGVIQVSTCLASFISLASAGRHYVPGVIENFVFAACSRLTTM